MNREYISKKKKKSGICISFYFILKIFPFLTQVLILITLPCMHFLFWDCMSYDFSGPFQKTVEILKEKTCILYVLLKWLCLLVAKAVRNYINVCFKASWSHYVFDIFIIPEAACFAMCKCLCCVLGL